MRFLITLYIVLFCQAISADSVNTRNTDKSYWEMGVGAGALSLSHYLGSSEQKVYASPLPYFVYSGKYIKADRKGIRGVLWQEEDWELNLSTKLALPVDSKDNNARQNMPDLDPLIEFGPSLNYYFIKSKDDSNSFSFQLPLRAAYSFDGLKASHRGWVVNPTLDYSYSDDQWKLNIKLGSVSADQKFHQYYYGIDQQFTTASRNFYEAKSGLAAYRFSTSVSKRLKNWYIGAFIEYYDLHDAINSDSALLQTSTSFNSGLFFAWIFKVKEI